MKERKERGEWERKHEITEWSVTFSLSLMDPFPRIDIFVRVSSCSLFNEFPRGPRSLPTKLNCNREWERGSVRICTFEIQGRDISYVTQTRLNHQLKLMKTYQQFFPVCVLIGSVWEHLRYLIPGSLCFWIAQPERKKNISCIKYIYTNLMNNN